MRMTFEIIKNDETTKINASNLEDLCNQLSDMGLNKKMDFLWRGELLGYIDTKAIKFIPVPEFEPLIPVYVTKEITREELKEMAKFFGADWEVPEEEPLFNCPVVALTGISVEEPVITKSETNETNETKPNAI